MTTGPVDVDVQETWDDGHSGRTDFTGSCRDADRIAVSHRCNAAVLDNNNAVSDFFKRRQNAVGENGSARHECDKWYLKPHRKS